LHRYKGLTEFINETKRAVILCHRNADPDAVCSAFAFSRLLKRINRKLKVELVAVAGVSRLSKQVLRHIPAKFVQTPNLEVADAIILADTGALEQLGDLRGQIQHIKRRLIILDHHAPHAKTARLAPVTLIDEKASSTCEIVYKIFQSYQLKPSRMEALALLLGILCDSRHFVLANYETLKIAVKLIELGAKLEKAIAILQSPMTYSERLARLKAAQRLVVERIKEWMVVTCRVGAYQASAARAAIMLGAHVAIAGGEKRSRLKISLRASRDFYEKTKVHLGRDIARPVGEAIAGIGGGHALAAGISGVGDAQKTMNQCLEAIVRKLDGGRDTPNNSGNPYRGQ